MSFRAKSQPASYAPDRGDVIHTDFSPSAGSETARKQFAVVLTPRSYNQKTGRAVVFPITSKRKGYPFEVPLAALPPFLPVAGVILADQVRTIDLRARGSQFAGRVSPSMQREIVDLLFALLEGEA